MCAVSATLVRNGVLFLEDRNDPKDAVAGDGFRAARRGVWRQLPNLDGESGPDRYDTVYRHDADCQHRKFVDHHVVDNVADYVLNQYVVDNVVN